MWSSESQEHVDAPHLHWTVGEHCWTTSSRVLVTIDDNAVACYDPTNGVVRLISLPSEAAGRSITAVQKFITFGTDIIAIGMDGFMHRMQLSKNYAFVAEATYVNKALAGHSAAFVEASPSKRSLLVTTINGFMFEYVLVADEVHKVVSDVKECESCVILEHLTNDQPPQIMETHTGAINCVVAFRDGKKFATGGADGTLCVWNSSTHSIMHRVPVGSAVTALACAPWSPLMVAGTANGQILAFEVGSENPRLIAHHFVHIGAVQQVGGCGQIEKCQRLIFAPPNYPYQIAFDATGAFFASCSNENGVVLYSIAGGKIHPVGHLITEGTVTGITWKSVNGGQVGNVDQQSLLYVLSNTKQGSSTVSRFHVNTNAMDTTESLTTDDVNVGKPRLLNVFALNYNELLPF